MGEIGPLLAQAAALLSRGRAVEAGALAQRAVAEAPADPGAWFQLARALRDIGDRAGAFDAFQKAADLNPSWAAPRIDLGNIHSQAGRWSRALPEYETALRLAPNLVAAQVSLAVALRQVGRHAEALALFRAAQVDTTGAAGLHSRYLFALTQAPGVSREAVFAAHLKFGQRFGQDWIAPHANDRTPDRPLRVGYVSGDLAGHAVVNFIAPVLAAHDPARVGTVIYSTAPPSAAPERHPGAWREAAGLDDAALAEAIRADRIDILVDLSGHTGLNRLAVFGAKPAPVQVSWIGYPNTTGLSQIDYRLTDRFTAGPETEAFLAEAAFHMPGAGACYQPFEDLPITPPPAQALGCVTFGATNAPSKLNAAVFDTWAEILRACPDSRLALKYLGLADGYLIDQITRAFAARGVDPGRLSFAGASPFAAYMAGYSAIDILLDPFPYTGGTTTRNALWMGVPVVTLKGQALYERISSGLLAAIGLDDCIATSRPDYVAKAVALAGDLGHLAILRQEIRPRLMASGHFDPSGFTRDLEDAYREMWRRWRTASL